MATKKNLLANIITQKFNEEQNRHKYGKKQPIPKMQYIRPIFFAIILSVTLAALVSKIFEVIKYFINQ